MLSLQTRSALTKETSSLNRKYIRLTQILATVVLSFIIAPAAMSEGIYKWVDDNGKIHYGSQRPEDADAEKMKLHVPEPASKPESQKEAEEENLEGDQKKEATLEDHADQEKANKERSAYCAKERKRLQTVQKNKQIHQKDASGKVSKLSSEARNKRLNKIKANISKYCK
ncbi:MAG: DUF4124 domain-containing protein [Gammaproteobacteria bacterium]|nr:DUF4124 domain-containing protein [Gammaproteobacteria bacterium]MCK5262245.1 DUF4124 domain-containing protein [Gammaproteobacteria bacterium]